MREHCARIAARARWVAIDARAGSVTSGVAGLDAEAHPLEAPADDVRRYVLIMDTTNFGSGWFRTLGLRDGHAGAAELNGRLAAHVRARGRPWTAAELRALEAHDVAAVFRAPARHPLMGHYAAALRELGRWLGSRSATDAVAAAEGSAERLAAQLAAGMTSFADAGFYKRAQIAANDLALAGVATFDDHDRLTVFADNLLPHVLRLDGVLSYDTGLAAKVDAGEELPAGGDMETEIRACTVHACEALARRAGVAPRVLDNWLWNRGADPPYRDRLPHRTRTVFY